VRHHRTQPGPWYEALGADTWETLVHPFHQRANAVGTNVAVVAVELGSSCNPETVVAKTAGHQLGFIIQQADRRRGSTAGFVGKVDGNGIALDRIDVHTITQLGSQRTAGRTGADHHAIKMQGFFATGVADGYAGLLALCRPALPVLAIAAMNTKANGCGCQTIGKQVD